MSRHHMLPPLVFVPQQQPKKIESRKSRIQTRAAGTVDDTGDIEETYQPIEPDAAMMAGANSPLDNFFPVEGSGEKPQYPMGRLSEGTLKVLLLAQEGLK